MTDDAVGRKTRKIFLSDGFELECRAFRALRFFLTLRPGWKLCPLLREMGLGADVEGY